MDGFRRKGGDIGFESNTMVKFLTENTKKERPRRGFLKGITAAFLGILLGRSLSSGKNTPAGDKIKLLTPDGKLVEVDRSKIHEVSPERASNREVLSWMKKDNQPIQP